MSADFDASTYPLLLAVHAALIRQHDDCRLEAYRTISAMDMPYLGHFRVQPGIIGESSRHQQTPPP